MKYFSCFKAYDIRGKFPEELNSGLMYKLGRAYASFIKPKSVAIGRDIRLSSKELSDALSEGLTDSGVNVFDIGLCGTEMIYFAVPHLKLDGGIMITASHNPPEYNGIKLIREKAIPISGDTGLYDIESLIYENSFPTLSSVKGKIETINIMKDFTKHVLSFIDADKIKPLNVLVNPGNGCAGLVLDELEKHLPVKMIKMNFSPDGTFPNGVPNPLIPENRNDTKVRAIAYKADISAAWDGDFDRCFFFDEKGEFIEGYYIVGMFAKALLRDKPGEKIIHDPRLTWNTVKIVKEMKGIPIVSKTGHAFIKERMRKEDALYGGEMSAHHYFRRNFYCDSGMIPFLLALKILSEEAVPLSVLIKDMKDAFPVSGEINLNINNPNLIIKKIQSAYDDAEVDNTDGISMDFKDWRFNLRSSNTEPLVRLNVETRGDCKLLETKTDELLKLIKSSA